MCPFRIRIRELTTAWELSGIALRMGIDLGFDSFIYDDSDKEIDNLRNLVFWGVI